MRAIIFFVGLTLNSFSQSWMQIAPFPGLSRDDGVSVTIGNKAYVGTGLVVGWSFSGDFYSFDGFSQTWNSIASMPLGTERQYACAFKGNDGFYVFGGDGVGGTLNTLYKYNLVLDNWEQKTSKPGFGIYGASCFIFGDTAIICGGRFSGNIVNDEVWLYRLSTDTWQQLNNMPPLLGGGRWRAAYTELLGKGYVLFGLDKDLNWRKELLEYDPRFDTWQKIMDVSTFPSLAYSSMQGISGSLVVNGGVDSLYQFSNACHYYELSSSSWHQGPQFPSPARRGGMTWVLNNKVYYTCGLDENENRLNETWMLDLVLSTKTQSAEENLQVWFDSQRETFNINSKFEWSYVLYNLQGKILLSQKLNVGITLVLSSIEFPKGLYFVCINQGSQTILRKKIVKE